MSTEFARLLRELAPRPTSAIDIDQIWEEGLTRRSKQRRGGRTALITVMLLLCMVATLLTFLVARDTTDTALPADSVVSYTDPERGFSVSYPSAWHRATSALTPRLHAPGEPPWELLSLATFEPIAGGGQQCQHIPVVALESMTARDAFVTVQERPPSAQVDPEIGRPPLPAPLPSNPSARPPDNSSEALHCLAARPPIDFWQFTFSEASRSFHMFVAIGSDAPASLRSQAWAVVASIDFQ